MVLIKRDDARRYLITRLSAQNDLTNLECQLMIGAVKIGKSGTWIGPFVTALLSEYAAGERTSVSQVMAKLAESVNTFERAAAGVDPKMLSKFTGKWPEKVLPRFCATCGLTMAEYAGPEPGERGHVCQTPGCVADCADQPDMEVLP